jgi:hypothetical protein
MPLASTARRTALPLPDLSAVGSGIFPCQRLGHQHAPPARRQVILMQVAHRELPPLEVQILNSQSQGLHQSQPLLVAHPFPQRQSSAGVARAMWAWG